MRASSVAPSQSSSAPLHASAAGPIEHAPHCPVTHVWLPAEHAPGRGHARVALPEHAQRLEGLAVPSQFSSTMAPSHTSGVEGLTNDAEPEAS